MPARTPEAAGRCVTGFFAAVISTLEDAALKKASFYGTPHSGVISLFPSFPSGGLGIAGAARLSLGNKMAMNALCCNYGLCTSGKVSNGLIESGNVTSEAS